MLREELYRNILTSLLDCGYADLSILDGCKYDFNDLQAILFECGMEINLNNLAWAMFEKGKRGIANWIYDRKDELEDILDSEDNTDMFPEIKEELEALKELEPYEDIESFHNFLDTNIWIKRREEIYRKFCQEALYNFENMTGFSL